MTTKTWRLTGEVSRHEKKDITKRVSEGVGDNKTTRIVDEEVFVLTVLGKQGQRAHFSQDQPFEINVGDDVVIKLEYGLQTSLDEHAKKSKKGKD